LGVDLLTAAGVSADRSIRELPTRHSGLGDEPAEERVLRVVGERAPCSFA
jgi:hypothetical protein